MTKIEAMKARYSARTFEPRSLSDADLNKLRELMADTTNPMGIPMEFFLLDAQRDHVTSPAITNEGSYVAGKLGRVDGANAAFGYVLERIMIEAWEAGMGSIWLAGTIRREQFEAAINLRPDEFMPAAAAFGYASSDFSNYEKRARKRTGGDFRRDFEEVFFDGNFETPLTREASGDLETPLEMVRKAPSGSNLQPWRLVVDGNRVHFFESWMDGIENEKWGDIQKCDLGIAMYHFEAAAEELGITGAWSFSDPGLARPADTDYVSTFTVNR